VSGPADVTGKHRGTDLLDGTVTLPLIIARERDAELGALDLRSVTTAEQAERVCATIEATGALDSARERALTLVADAQGDLGATRLGHERAQALARVADSVVARYR
jgi:geranylgeranyl pyrophosphate synthase